MTLAITATKVGAQSPQAVLLTVSGATLGDSYTVTGLWSGLQWTVRGAASAVAPGTQLLAVDVAFPINVPIVYTVTHDADGATASAAAVTVPYAGRAVLSSIDSLTVVNPSRIGNNGAPRERILRTALFPIPGRTTPVVRSDVTAGLQAELVVDTIDTDTDALDALIAAGGVMMLRTDGSFRDLPAVELMSVQSAPSALLGVDDVRTWTLGYQVISDPEPSAVIAIDTWDDFDSVYALLTWTNFDTEWSTGTWNQFDVVDWATR